ncbi:MAG: hypothetical protein Q8S26_10030 [Azonexus sp.]|nr:hypothetical protein [Azonexus sp.]
MPFNAGNLGIGIAWKSRTEEWTPCFLPARVVARLAGRHSVSKYKLAELGDRY